MRNSLFLILVAISVVVNSCAYNKITFGQRNKEDKTEELIEKKQNANFRIDSIEDKQLQLSKTSHEENSEEESYVQKLSVKLDEAIEKSDLENIVEIKKIAFDKSIELRSHKLETDPRQNGESESGKAFIIIGSILFILGVIAVLGAIYKINNSTIDGNGGCIDAIFSGMLLIALGSVIGIAGIVFIIIGLVITSSN